MNRYIFPLLAGLSVLALTQFYLFNYSEIKQIKQKGGERD